MHFIRWRIIYMNEKNDGSFNNIDNTENNGAPEFVRADGQKQKGSELFDWAQALVTAIIFIVVVFIFVGRIIGVEGTSMVPTLHEGDRVVLQTIFYKPEAGDIVVLTKESFGDEPIVKRVIATEGQTVDINFDTGEVWVDGELLDEPYINEATYRQGDIEFPLTIDDGCIFVMGDNRNKSTDSRFSSVGMIDERCVLGRVIFRIYPFSDMGVIE